MRPVVSLSRLSQVQVPGWVGQNAARVSLPGNLGAEPKPNAPIFFAIYLTCCGRYTVLRNLDGVTASKDLPFTCLEASTLAQVRCCALLIPDLY